MKRKEVSMACYPKKGFAQTTTITASIQVRRLLRVEVTFETANAMIEEHPRVLASYIDDLVEEALYIHGT